jgi:hypothetical protein
MLNLSIISLIICNFIVYFNLPFIYDVMLDEDWKIEFIA